MSYIATRTGPDELYHYGVKGMKWGRRRERNNGSATARGDKRRINKKKIAGMAIMTASVAAAAAVYGTNPVVKKTVNNFISSAGNKTISSLKRGSKKTVDTGKRYVKEAVKSAKTGIKEGIKEAPKKATKAIVTGVTLNAAKRMLDKTVGKEESARIFQANNSKKISSFWKVGGEDREKDD